MQVKTILIALGVASTACAKCPGIPEGTWRAPRSGEARSPCPMLNVLANHGFLPRDGKNINRTACRNAMKKGLNLDADFADLMFDPALLTNPLPAQDNFNLDHLNRHNILEHDGSLSRADAFWDDSQVFNETVYSMTLDVLSQSDTVTLESAAAARLLAVETSRAANPTFVLNSTNEGISLGETAAYMLALGDRVSGTVPLERVRLMFEEERLPFEFGWSPNEVSTSADELFALTQRIIDSTAWPAHLKARSHAGFHGGLLNGKPYRKH